MIAFNPMDAAGFLPLMLDPHDRRVAREQLDQSYAHGGGWRPFEGFTLTNFHPDYPGDAYIEYPGDPAMRELSRGTLRDETIIVFECDWVAIVQPGGAYEIARMD